MEIFCLSCLTALLLLIWFDSDAFVEYVKLFRIGRFFFVPKYEGLQNKYPEDDLTYPDFLAQEHDCFFTRLISCPLCVSVWITAALLFGSHAAFYLNFAAFPIINVLGLLMYFLIKLLMEKSYGT